MCRLFVLLLPEMDWHERRFLKHDMQDTGYAIMNAGEKD
jgi:hypothetical protein